MYPLGTGGTGTAPPRPQGLKAHKAYPSGAPDPELLDNLSAEHMKPGIHLIIAEALDKKIPNAEKKIVIVIRKIRII